MFTGQDNDRVTNSLKALRPPRLHERSRGIFTWSSDEHGDVIPGDPRCTVSYR